MTEIQKLRARIDRDILAIDQKIERQDQAIRNAAEIRADLLITRQMLVAAISPVQEAAK